MDRLKFINDNYGHEAGDDAIKKQAFVLQNVFRTSDVIGRLGGDEFAIVTPNLTTKEIPIIKKRIKQKFTEISQNEKSNLLSMSLGYAVFDKENCSIAKLLITADKKLYQDKNKKKGLGKRKI